MALWRTGEEAMAGLVNPQGDVTRFEMAGRLTVATALQKVAHRATFLSIFPPVHHVSPVSINEFSFVVASLPRNSSAETGPTLPALFWNAPNPPNSNNSSLETGFDADPCLRALSPQDIRGK